MAEKKKLAIIDGKQRSADAIVSEAAHLAVLSRGNFLRFIRNNPTVALEMLSATFGRRYGFQCLCHV